MKEYEVAIDGRPHRIQIGDLKIETPISVTVDNKKVDITIKQVGESPNRFILKVAEVNFAVEAGPEQAPKIIRIDGKPFTASVREAFPPLAPRLARPSRGVVPGDGPRAEISASLIAAPMPGRVISLLVKSGERVKVGQLVLLLEAMKMENEIIAHKAGTIKSIKVAEGSTVKKDDPLVEIA